MANSYVSVRELVVDFDERILDGVFMDLKKGEFLSVVGKSGVGKTTLLNCLADLQDYKGVIKKPAKVAYVFQDHSLFPWMTVSENIAFGASETDPEKLSRTVSRIIERIGLCGKEGSYPSQLSGGQRQRVAIGRALAFEPDLLLMDEPFASLDGYTRLKMQEWIRGILSKSNATTILVTHDVDEAVLLSDRIVVLKDGKLSQSYKVPFLRPRRNSIRYEKEFQEIKMRIHNDY